MDQLYRLVAHGSCAQSVVLQFPFQRQPIPWVVMPSHLSSKNDQVEQHQEQRQTKEERTNRRKSHHLFELWQVLVVTTRHTTVTSNKLRNERQVVRTNAKIEMGTPVFSLNILPVIFGHQW